MPHAESKTMSQPTVNGDHYSSQFISHLASYPLVSDSITTFKSNPFGQKSISLGKKSISIADQGYNLIPYSAFIPYAYGYVKPYVAKADSIADDGLSKVDSTFPIVKEDTQKLKGSVMEIAFFPLKLAGSSKDYVFNTYSSEYEKCGGRGYVSGGKALITTSLVVTSDSLAWLGSLLSEKKEQTKEVVHEKSYL